MKKGTNIILIGLVAACLAVFFGYRMLDTLRSDTVAPEIYMDENIPEISVADPRSVLLQGVTAIDNKDGDVTASLVVEGVSLQNSDGSLMVSYAAFDKAGNVSKAQREVRYTDYENPKFTLRAPLLYSYGTNFDVLSTIGAVDVIDGDIQHRIRATALDSTSIAGLGIHDVQFQVTNSLGDMTSYVLPVEVYDSEMYDGNLILTEYLVYLNAGEAFVPRSYLNTFVLRGEETNLQRGIPSGYSLKITGEVQTQTPGVYPVEFRVTYTMKHETDPEKDQRFTGYSKLIVIVEG